MKGLASVVALLVVTVLVVSVVTIFLNLSLYSSLVKSKEMEAKEVRSISEKEVLSVDSVGLTEGNLTIIATSLYSGLDVNKIKLFLNHRYVGSCNEGNVYCSDESGNYVLNYGEKVTIRYPTSQCSFTVVLDYLGSTTTSVVDLCYWSCRRKIVVHSLYSLSSYPVKVELNASNFDFSQTDGNDIRVTDENGNKLPYWIEVWDESTPRAVLWFSSDLVAGDTNFYLYYCNPSATSESNGYQVFDWFDFNDANLLAVFHFDEGSGTSTADETGRYSATFVGSPKWVEGRYGYGVEFDGSSYLSTDYNESPNSFTYILWVKAFTNNDYDRIIYDGNWSRVLAVYSTNTPYIQFSSKTSVATSSLDASWHSLVVKVGGGYQSLIVDGAEEVNDTISSISPRAGSTYIGGDGVADFNGVVDELIMYGRLLTSQEINALTSGYFDHLTSVWVVRKRVDPEPAVTIGAEETGSWNIT